MTEVPPGHGPWRVLQRDDTFALLDLAGDIGPADADVPGLFRGNTRFLSCLALTLNGLRPFGLGAALQEGDGVLVTEMTNPELTEAGRVAVPQGELHVFRAKLLWAGALYEHVRVSHFGSHPARVELALHLGADFVELEPPGTALTVSAQDRPVRTERLGAQLRFARRAADGRERRTRVSLRPAPADLDTPSANQGEGRARWTVQLAPQGEFHLFVEVCCEIEGRPASDPLDYETAYRFHREDQAATDARRPALETPQVLVNRWLARARCDLSMLCVQLPTGPYPLAGVPFEALPLGRDGLLVARAMLWLDPSLARGVLSHLAGPTSSGDTAQGTAGSGRIANCGPADGAAVTTPLFIALAGAYVRRTNDLGFACALWTGLAAPAHADRMATRLLEPAFFSGFGIRTLASGQARYNPIAAFHGAVWPQDTALVAAGLARYGHLQSALRLFDGLLDASHHFEGQRLPACFSGFARREGQGPAVSPGTFGLHAGAAASVFTLLQACLGLDIDAARARVCLRAPRLPASIDVLRLEGLQVGPASLDLVIERNAASVGVEVTRKAGEVAVRVLL